MAPRCSWTRVLSGRVGCQTGSGCASVFGGFTQCGSVFPPLKTWRGRATGARREARWRALLHVRALHARVPPRGRAWAARSRARPRLQAAARQAAGAAARPGSGHQGGPRGAGGAEGRERGCQGRRRRIARFRREWRAFKRGAEPRLHRLLQAAVRHGRRAGEAPHL
eukprot:scaffold4786_cov65-Phaeocystis_antarctica.AAC.2